MAYSALTTAETGSGKPVTQAKMRKVKDNFDYLYGLAVGSAATGVVVNGSFEVDSDSDGTPDGWTLALYPGGAFTLSSTAPDQGAYHAKFTHPGGASNGGGSLASDYVEISDTLSYVLHFIHWASAAGMKNQVKVQYYDKDKVANGAAVTLYSSTANPTSPLAISYTFTPSAGSCFAKFTVIGGLSDTDVAGSAYFDGLALETLYPSALGDFCGLTMPIERSEAGAVYVKHKECTLDRPGNYRIEFDLAAGNGRLTVGGVNGTEQTAAGYATKSEDFTKLAAGTVVSLYIKGSGAATCKNLCIRNADGLVPGSQDYDA